MKLENYFRRFGIRNGSGAESSVSAVHLHYRRSADRLRPEHHRRSRKDRRYCKRHENRRPPIRQSPVRRIPLRNLPACQCRSLRPACQILRKTAGCRKSMAVGAVLNALLMIMVVLGIMTVYQNPEMSQQSVPTLFMVRQGVGSKFMTPLISVLIILGAVSTAVNMVAAMVKRIHAGLAERSSRTETAGKISRTQILAALVCCIADFLIAQFGLLTLIQKVYSILAYLAIPVILVPYVVHMAVMRFDTKKIEKNNKKICNKNLHRRKRDLLLENGSISQTAEKRRFMQSRCES